MGNIRHLGPVEMFECSTCKERYVGPRENRATQTWLTAHRKSHWVDNKSQSEWDNQ